MALFRAGFSSNFLIKSKEITRNLSLTSSNRVKEIVEKKEKGVIKVEGITKAAPRDHLLVKEVRECKENGTQFCPKCTLGLDVKHTDVLILSQYVRSDGCMLPRRITGLCRKQQVRMSCLVSMAQKAGLMPNLNPAYSKKDPLQRFGHKKFNKYFDENTIRQR
ncbi:large ribosomal subunit protein mL66 [Culicoides brevitarsis]|uniref:large ribosomal subunit protein mL66 n=1 Tax=Culicoides brevitarsis TaxID=469753 RepID=UPI00307B6B71